MNNFPDMTEERRQELISDCQAEIVGIEKALTTWGEGWISYLQSKLKRQKIALAALTAEPDIEKEEWKEIEWSGGAYSISSMGRIKSNRSGKFLSTNSRAGSGYVSACIHINGERKQTTIHRLVADAFLEREEGKDEVNHINGIKTDNRYFNLEWVSRSENVNHSYYELGNNVKPLIAEPINGIGPSLLFRSGMEAEKNGFHSSHIYACLRGEYSQHRGYKWSYYNTVPPAPVLRLPGEVSCEGLDPQEADEARNLGQCEGWNQCLAEIKSLNNQPAPTEASNEQ